MLKRLKIKLLKTMIWLCDMALTKDEGAEDQNEINWMVAQRNDLLKQLRALTHTP